ncbi:hypothetical protein [Geodermatophilus sp. URMC 63]
MTSRTTTPATTRSTARTWLRRLDTYTLEVFNPGLPYRPRRDRATAQG